MKNKAFTLAEVLITLVIIGVIAAMTIPTLMGNTNDQEYRSKFKKAFSAASQAVTLDHALYGTLPGPYHSQGDLGDCTMHNVQILKNHMSVIEDQNDFTFKTADGIIYSVDCGFFAVNLAGDKEYCPSDIQERSAGEPKCMEIFFDWENGPTTTKLIPTTILAQEMLYN